MKEFYFLLIIIIIFITTLYYWPKEREREIGYIKIDITNGSFKFFFQGWEERRTTTGRTYYVNHHSRTTHWLRPTQNATST